MSIILWVGFLIFVAGMLFVDLYVVNKDDHVINMTQAFTWSGICVVTTLIFNVGIYFIYEHNWLGMGSSLPLATSGKDAAMQFFTGWLIEQSLSLDNIFVIAVIFSFFRVPLAFQHRVLFWGIVGAVVMRGVMIGVGVALIQNFSWVMYVFGVLLIITAIKMFTTKDEEVHPDKNILIKIAKRLMPFTTSYDGHNFFTYVDGKRCATPLFLVLLVIESTDLLFAFDSVPAIFAITQDPFLVFTSNIFAIINLRSMYFVLANVLDRFHYVKTSLVVVLLFIGVKMLLIHHYPIPTNISLLVIVGCLAAGFIASMLVPYQSSAEKREEGSS